MANAGPFSRWRSIDAAFDQKQRLDARERVAHSVRVDQERVEHILPQVTPTAGLGGFARSEEVVVDRVRVGYHGALVAPEQLVDRGAVMMQRELKSTCLPGATSTQKCPRLQRCGYCTSTPVASVQT